MLERYYRELQRFLSGKLKDRDTASDLVQESYLRVLAMQQAGECITDPRALLYRVANNLVIDRHRRATTRNEDPLPDRDAAEQDGIAAPPAWEPEVAAMSAQGVDALLNTIDGLPPRCREAFILYKFDDLSYAEIGARMGISVRTVEMQLQIAMAACWTCLERLHADDATAPALFRQRGKARTRRS